MKKTCCLLKILIKNDGKYVYIPTLVVIIFEIVNILINHTGNIFQLIRFILGAFILFSVIVFIFGTEYRDFKLTSQLGYSRKTLWKSKICELIILSILTLIFSSINFSSNKLINEIVMYLIILTGYSTILAFGNLISLVSWKTRIVLVSILILIIYGITSMISKFVNGRLFNELFGITTQYINIIPIIEMLIWILLMVILSYLFTMKQHFRKE